jgi:hypothetical protein
VGDRRNAYRVLVKKPEEPVRPGVDGRVMIESIIEKSV